MIITGAASPPHHLKEENNMEVTKSSFWEDFKRKEFAIVCKENKKQFFTDCMQHGIHVFLSDFAKERNLFVCCLRYDNRLSPGRYELFAFKGWETKPNGLYGANGLPEIDYDNELKSIRRI